MEIFENLVGVVRKQGNKFCIFSKSGKKLSCHETRQEAVKRLGQIEFFKRHGAVTAKIVAKESPDMRQVECSDSVKASSVDDILERNTLGDIS